MAEFPALPIWTDAYMLDCGHLSDAEHGRYFLLLMLIWRSPGCRIPADPKWIARKLKRTPEEYENQIMPLIAEFCYTTGNWVEQKRLREEYLYLQKQSKKQSDIAKLRWNKDKDVSHGNARPMPDRCQTDAPTPTPTPIEERKKEPSVLSLERKLMSDFPQNLYLDEATQRVADSLDLTDNEITYEIEAMRDWAANAGSKGRKKDWQAFARGWFRRNSKKGKTNGKTTPDHKSNTIAGGFEIIDRAIDDLRRREQRGNDLRNGNGEADPQDLPRLFKIPS